MILLIDNYDSFVHNLARHVGMLGRERRVVRNNEISINDISQDPPDAIILSPGPCTPSEAGICNEVIRKFGNRIPILGVCLGHQCIGEVYGGQVIRAPEPVHGRASLIEHNGDGIFMGLPNPLMAGRYHSLVVHVPANAPLAVTAQTEDDRIIMAFQHKTHPVYGIQFHPESCLTDHGIDILRNFMSIADEWNMRLRKAA
ncbi:MAG: aminodeoxychorismate/anthranilate synthase component II [Micavibrio aeruginosavorus]|uniref:Aminodeoxychorismate/anthranilate synthase component II n=1 Tax=Micavibrio aeruginosavorus TaxID=349221 RepID=A0A2W5NAX3_9BACT|nr:MAG: aminodeoxychorismate/anthranilate synthase component II [Micavibrio aeruginosavorus]